MAPKSAIKLAITSIQLKKTPIKFTYSTFHPKIESNFDQINNLNDAVTVFNQMLQFKPPPHVSEYTKLFNILVKMNHFQEVILMFKELSVLGYSMNEYYMSIVINCYCKLKKVDLGFAIVSIFMKRGYCYSPNIVSITCLIKGLCVEQRVVEAGELFRKVIRYGMCEGNEIASSVVLDGLCKSGNVVEALVVLRDLENVDGQVNAYGYTAVIDGLCKSTMVDEAMCVLCRMIKRGFLPDVVTYTALIRELCDLRRIDEARKLLKEMIDDGVYPNVQTFTNLVDVYCKERLMEDAENVVEVMKQGGVKPDVVTYTALMEGYCLEGEFDKGLEVLNRMADEGLKPDAVSYGTIIKGYCKHKKLDHAWEVFKALQSKGLKPTESLYNTMIHELNSVGRCIDALELYNEMKIVDDVDDVTKKSSTMT